MASVVSDDSAKRLTALQRRIVDEKRQVIAVFEGRSGRVLGRVVNEFMNLLEPRGILYTHFSPESMACPRERLRYISREPARGVIGIYDRSWFTDLVEASGEGKDLVVRTGTVLEMERYFTACGVVLVKFYLDIDDDSLERLGELFQSKKLPKSTILTDDHIDSKKWKDKVVLPLLKSTSTPEAPWNTIRVDELRQTMEDVVGTFISRVTDAFDRPIPLQREDMVLPYCNPRADADLSLKADDYKAELVSLSRRIADAQARLASSGRSLVVVFEGWDAAGKGGSIKRLTRALNPRGYYVRPVAAPTGEERLHTYLWRFAYSVPKQGRITIYDRSWYGRMMVEPIEGLCTDDEYSRSAREINVFERQIVESGGIVVKLWMEISPEEQLRRFEARQEDPVKRWKITDEDWRNREKWSIYEEHVDRMISATSTPWAPWTVVESEDKKYGRLKVLRTVAEALENGLKKNRFVDRRRHPTSRLYTDLP